MVSVLRIIQVGPGAHGVHTQIRVLDIGPIYASYTICDFENG